SHNLVLRELRQLMGGTRGGRDQHAEYEGALLLEEKDVAWPLRVDPAAKDAQRVLVVVGDLDVRMGLGGLAPVGGRLVQELSYLLIRQLIRAGGELGCLGPLSRLGEGEALQHESPLELEEEDLLEPLPVGKRADGAEHVFPVLARAAVVNAHASLRDRAGARPN